MHLKFHLEDVIEKKQKLMSCQLRALCLILDQSQA